MLKKSLLILDKLLTNSHKDAKSSGTSSQVTQSQSDTSRGKAFKS